jgi:hypothetical protein
MLMIGVCAWAVPVWAQAERPDTPTAVPDAEAKSGQALPADDTKESPDTTERKPKSWREMVDDWMKVRPVAKQRIIRIDDQYCYPHGAVSFKMEIVREDDDTVWVRGIPPENPESALHKLWLRREATQRDLLVREELAAEYGMAAFLLDFEGEPVPPPFMDGLKFESGPSDLPDGGLWQMNFAVDDMNGDGRHDLVFPPTRKGSGVPFIFLGSGDGGFEPWKAVKWAPGVSYDYGGVATGDFDGDGQRDIVLAVHFKPQYVLYGDGKGGFERSQRLPSPDPRMSSRAPTVADFNGDGRDDVAFQAEIDMDLGVNEQITGVASVWVVLSLEGGWRLQTAGLPEGVIGDNISAEDVDADGDADLVVAPGTMDWRALVYFNRGDDGWQQIPTWQGVLSAAYHFDVDVYGEGENQQLFAVFTQFRSIEGTTRAVTGLISYRLGEEGLEAKDGPISYDHQRYNPRWRIAAGDLNGDGRPDLVVGRKGGGLEVFVQTPSGEFYLEQSPELEQLGRPYGIQLVDLDGDSKDDLVACFATIEDRPGGVRVWLTRDKS